MPSRLQEIVSPAPALRGRSRLAEIDAAAGPDPTWIDRAVTTGFRTLPSIFGTIAGGFGGAALTAPSGPGAIAGGTAGAVAGGALGGALGETGAQAYEGIRGLRKDYSPKAIGIEALLGGIPLGKSATWVRAGLKGAGMNVAGTQLHSRAETGEWADAGTSAKSAILGFLFGAGGEKGAQWLGTRRAAREAAAAEREAAERLAMEPDDVAPFGPQPAPHGFDLERFDEAPPSGFREYDPLDVAANMPTPRRPIETDIAAMREADDEIAERLASEDLQTYRPGRYKGTAPVVGGSRLSEIEDALATDAEFNTDQFYERIRAGSNFDQHLVGEAAREAEITSARMAQEAEAARTQAIFDDMAAAREVDDAFAERMALEEMPTYPLRERGTPDAGWRAPQEVGEEIAGDDEISRMLFRERMRTGDFRNVDAPQRQVPPVTPRVQPEPDSLTDFLAMQERASGEPPRMPLDPDYARQLERIETMHGARKSGIGDYIDADAEIARERAAVAASESIEDIAARRAAERQRRFEEPRYPTPPRKPWEVEAQTPQAQALRGLIPERLLSQRGDISHELASGIGGGVVGGLYGATQGEDTDDRIRNALLMGAAGASGAAGLTRMLSGRTAGQLAEALPRTIPERKYPTATGGKLGEHMASARVLEFDPNTGPKPPVEAMPRAQRENLGLEKFAPEQRDTIQELVNEYGYGPLEAQRRGRQSTERTNWLAQAVTVPAGRKLAPGTNMSAEGHVAYGNAVASVQDQLREVAQRIKQTGGSEADLLKQAELLEAHKVLFFSYAGLRTEAGRALNVYKAMKEALPSELRLVREMLDRGRLRADMADLADVLANLPKDPRAAMKALRAAQTRSKMEAFGSYFTANILSGIATQERNFLGNAARMLTRVGEKAVISRMDPLRAMLAGKAQGTAAAKFLGSPERQIFAGEASQEIKGMVASVDRAFWDAMSTMRHGFSIDATMSGLKNVTPLTIPRKEFIGGGYNPLNYPGRALEGVDRFFRNLNYSAELYALTHAQARRELGAKATDAALSQRVAELRANPSPTLQRRAAKSAEAAVFQNEAGPALKMLEAIKNQVPALQFLIPFVRTPAKIFEQGMRRTPGGFAMAGARSEDARDQAMAFGEAAIGTAVAAPLAWLAAKGQITGSGPTDPQKRQALMERGWRPNSINIPFLPDSVAQAMGAEKSDDGTYWVNYQLMQPYAVPLSIVANAFESWEEEGKKGGAMDATAQTVMRVGRSALDQSFLSGLSDFFDALNDPGRAAEQFFGRMASGMIPLSGALRSAARYVDPVVRQPQTWGEHVQSGIPGMSQDLTPKLTRFGEDVVRQGSPFVVPEVSGVNLDPISEELSRIGLDIGSPSDRLENTRLMRMLGINGELEPKDMLELQRLRGRTARASLAAVMGAPGYENLPDEVRAELLSRTLRKGSTKVNKLARAALIAQQPDLIRLLGDPMAEAAAKTYK